VLEPMEEDVIGDVMMKNEEEVNESG